REEAQDLTQEAYLRCLAARDDAKTFPPGWAFMQTVALNLIRDRGRRQRTHGTLTPLEDRILRGDLPSSLVDDNPLNTETDRIWLQELLAKLPRDYRTVLELRLIKGYSRKETAQQMGRSESAVRGLQYRALQLLRAMIKEHLLEVDGNA